MTVDRARLPGADDHLQSREDVSCVLDREISAAQSIDDIDHFRTAAQVDAGRSGFREHRSSAGGEAFALVHDSNGFAVRQSIGKLFAGERTEYTQLDHTDFAAFRTQFIDRGPGSTGGRSHNDHGHFRVLHPVSLKETVFSAESLLKIRSHIQDGPFGVLHGFRLGNSGLHIVR